MQISKSVEVGGEKFKVVIQNVFLYTGSPTTLNPFAVATVSTLNKNRQLMAEGPTDVERDAAIAAAFPSFTTLEMSMTQGVQVRRRGHVDGALGVEFLNKGERMVKKGGHSLCSKCDGKGSIEGFGHIKSGVCFRCGGAGCFAIKVSA